MTVLFLILQFSSLAAQLYFGVKGYKTGDMLEAGYGYAIWGGAVTVLLGMPNRLQLV